MAGMLSGASLYNVSNNQTYTLFCHSYYVNDQFWLGDWQNILQA